MTETRIRNYLNPIARGIPDSEIQTSLILACYKVAQYLPKFLASLDAQTVEQSHYELVFVIDGCPEDSEGVVKAWAQTSNYPVRVVSKANGGVASARNVGLVWARGEWVSSPDPDDVLEPNYLSRISNAQERFPESNMTVGRICLRDPAGNPILHPLDNKFVDEREREVDLRVTPDSIQTLGGSVFFRLQRIRELQLQHNERLTTASDADFIMHYLLRNDEKFVLVPSAHYVYQRRADESSIVKTQERNIDRFRTVFGVTHRSLLEQVKTECPQWLANTLLYFTYYLFRRNLQADSPVYETDPAVLEEIDTALRENLRRIGAKRVTNFRLFDVPIEMRMAWLAIARTASASSPVELLGHRPGSNLWQICYYTGSTSGARGLSTISNQASIIEKKYRAIEFLGSVWAYQQMLLVDSSDADGVALSCEDDFELELGGRALPAREIRNHLRQQRVQLPPSTNVKSNGFFTTVRQRCRRLTYSVSLRVFQLLGRNRPMKNAIVIDLEDHEAYEPGHQLSEVVREALGVPPGVKVWAVVDGPPRSSSSHWCAVRRGSISHFVLMKNATALISDRLPKYTQPPFPRNVLSTDWVFVLAAGTKPHARSYRKLNGTEIDFLIAEDMQESNLYTENGGYFRFMRSQVLMAPGYRQEATLR